MKLSNNKKKSGYFIQGVIVEVKENKEGDAGYEGVAKFYDLFANNEDLPFYMKYARKYGSPILDIAAGTGRVSFALAIEGFQVTSLEKSPSMLAVVRQKYENAPLEISSLVEIVEGNMTEFSLDMKYSLIIIPGSFGHAFTTEQQLSTLSCIRNYLDDDGVFILDLYPGGTLDEHSKFVDPPASLPDGRTVTRSGIIDIDSAKQSFQIHLTFRIENPNGNVKEIEVISHAAVIFNREVNLLLRIAGFEIIDEYGAFDERPYAPDCSRRILVLKKK